VRPCRQRFEPDLEPGAIPRTVAASRSGRREARAKKSLRAPRAPRCPRLSPRNQSRGGRRGRSARGEEFLGVRADTLLAGSATCALVASASSPSSIRVPSLEPSRLRQQAVQKPDQRIPRVLRVPRALRAFPPRTKVAGDAGDAAHAEKGLWGCGSTRCSRARPRAPLPPALRARTRSGCHRSNRRGITKRASRNQTKEPKSRGTQGTQRTRRRVFGGAGRLAARGLGHVRPRRQRFEPELDSGAIARIVAASPTGCPETRPKNSLCAPRAPRSLRFSPKNQSRGGRRVRSARGEEFLGGAGRHAARGLGHVRPCRQRFEPEPDPGAIPRTVAASRSGRRETRPKNQSRGGRRERSARGEKFWGCGPTRCSRARPRAPLPPAL
jgi:hypothetical protein